MDHTIQLHPEQQPFAVLPFPLDPQNAASIRYGLFLSGTVALSSGSATVVNRAINPTSTMLLTYASASGTQGYLRASAASGTMTIVSSSGSDSSTVQYLVLL